MILKRSLGRISSKVRVALVFIAIPALAFGAGSAVAADFAYYEGTLGGSEEVGSWAPPQNKITESSVRKLSATSGPRACTAARNGAGTLVGTWYCVKNQNNVASHPYCGCEKRTSVGKNEDYSSSVRGRWREHW